MNRVATKTFPQDGSAGEADEYRANFETCHRMARCASTKQEKRAWLDLAESWRLLIIIDWSVDEQADEQLDLELGDLIEYFYSKPLTF